MANMVRRVFLNKQKRSVSMLSNVKQMKHEDDFCDFTIRVKKTEVHAHRVIIAAGSPYFKAMLKHDTIESQERKVEMEDVDAECVRNCIDFMYSGEFDIPDGKIGKLLHVAIMMQLDDVKEAICNILDEELNSENFFQTRSIAVLYQLPTVLKKCKTYYGDNFMTISAQPGFQSEAKAHLVNILKSKKLKLSEDDKLVVSLRWIGNDPDKRGELLELIKLIKLEEFSVSYLSDLLESHPVISNDLALYKLINEPLVGYAEKNSNEVKNNDCQGDEILVIFDHDANCLQSKNEVEKFHDEKFKHLGDFTAICIDSFIYILCANKSVHRLNYKDKNEKWERMQSIIVDHGWCPLYISFRGSIFVIGSSGVSFPTSDVEKFDPVANQWLLLKDKPVAVKWHALVSVGDSFYCIGGWDGSKGVPTLCKFTPSTSKWVDLEPMQMARYKCSAVAVDHEIFVIGGMHHRDKRNDVECYDVTSRQWTFLCPMIECRGKFATHYIAGRMFSVSCNSTNDVEEYDIVNDAWRRISLSRFNIYDCHCVKF